MATTRLIPLHTGKGRNFGKAIRNVIGYVSNPKKTHQGELVTGCLLYTSPSPRDLG